MLAAGSIVLLWLAGYLMGRDAGHERGTHEGFVAARVEASDAARVAGLRAAMKRFAGQGTYEESYPVGRLVDERLAEKRSQENFGEKEIAAEMQAIVDETIRVVFPEESAADRGADFALRSVPEERTLHLRAAGPYQGRLALYLFSKEDFLVWQQAERAAHR